MFEVLRFDVKQNEIKFIHCWVHSKMVDEILSMKRRPAFFREWPDSFVVLLTIRQNSRVLHRSDIFSRLFVDLKARWNLIDPDDRKWPQTIYYSDNRLRYSGFFKTETTNFRVPIWSSWTLGVFLSGKFESNFRTEVGNNEQSLWISENVIFIRSVLWRKTKTTKFF